MIGTSPPPERTSLICVSDSKVKISTVSKVRHTRRVTFRGGARHAATTQRIVLGAEIHPPLDPHQLVPLIALHAPAPMNEMSNGKCDFRQTRAAGRVLDLLVASARPISWRHEERAERTAQPHRPLETSPSSKLELRPRINGEEDEDGQAHEDPRSTPYKSSATTGRPHVLLARRPSNQRRPPPTTAQITAVGHPLCCEK